MPSALWDALDDAMIMWMVREWGISALNDREFARYLFVRLSWNK